MADLRPDRLFSLYLLGPLERIATGRRERIPILMYHSISADPEPGSPYYRIQTTPKRFAEHMEFLKQNGYEVLPLQEAVKIIISESEPPGEAAGASARAPRAVLTFDDGYRDFYTAAFPILRRYGYPATVFLPVGFIGRDGGGLRNKNHLSWEEIRELQREGITFGSHTVNHPQLASLPERKVRYEIKVSRKRIEDRIGREVAGFSYPFAFPEGNRRFVRRLGLLLDESGYQHGVSTRIGTVHGPGEKFFLKRIPVNNGDEPRLFQAKLKGQYDYLHRVQYLGKWLKFNTVGRISRA